jgi:predicted nucleic acid-binding protein
LSSIPPEKLSLCRDPADDMILECCHTAKATLLITGDKDLLELADLPFDLQLIMPQQFVGD